MSTGADCRFYEKTPGQWFYDLQRWPYGENPDYDTHGPFPTFGSAHDHLGNHEANPGGYSSTALPGCPHDLKEPREDDRQYPFFCNRCGEFLKS